MKLTKKLQKERREFCVLLAQIKHRAGELGLLKTMHALDKGTQAVGWEVAELEEKNLR